jgi:hypothetical protein
LSASRRIARRRCVSYASPTARLAPHVEQTVLRDRHEPRAEPSALAVVLALAVLLDEADDGRLRKLGGVVLGQSAAPRESDEDGTVPLVERLPRGGIRAVVQRGEQRRRGSVEVHGAHRRDGSQQPPRVWQRFEAIFSGFGRGTPNAAPSPGALGKLPDASPPTG